MQANLSRLKFAFARGARIQLHIPYAKKPLWMCDSCECPPAEFECLGEPSLCTKRLAEDPGFAAEVTGDRPTAPGCHTPEGCRENGCLGWCDEHQPEAAKP